MSFVNENAKKRIRLVTLSIVAAAALLSANSAVAAPLGKQLVELESHITWAAVDNAWKNIRPRWVVNTGACDESKCVAAQLLELEGHTKWKAVDAAWTKRRTGWVSDCKAATTDVEVAGLLLEFEQNVRWQAIEESWKGRRDAWIARVKGN